MCLNFWNFEICDEIAWNFPQMTDSIFVVEKKLSLELAPIMLVLFQSLQHFTYIAFKGLLFINCLHSESHHIASKSFETFHTLPNDEVLMIKLSLGHCWFTVERSLQWMSSGPNLVLSLKRHHSAVCEKFQMISMRYDDFLNEHR